MASALDRSVMLVLNIFQKITESNHFYKKLLKKLKIIGEIKNITKHK